MTDNATRLLRISTAVTMKDPGGYTRREMTWDRYVRCVHGRGPKNKKDCGNIVGGWLAEDYRIRGNVLHRDVLILDADKADIGWAVDVGMDLSCAAVAHTTWSHTKDEPRWRLHIPMDRSIEIEQDYWRIAHAVMNDIVPKCWDKGSAEAERLMHCWSAQNNDHAWQQWAGPPLQTDLWLARAAELGVQPRPEAAEPVDRSLDVSEPVTAAEQAAADALLRRYADRLAEQEPGGGVRRLLLRSALLVLYGFVKGGCWDGEAEPVDAVLLQALEAQQATTKSHDATWAKEAADVWRITAPARPYTESSPADDFDTVPISDEADAREIGQWGAVSRGLAVREGAGGVRRVIGSTANEVANLLLHERWTNEDGCRLTGHWRGKQYEYRRTYWAPLGDKHMHGVVEAFLNGVNKRVATRDGKFKVVPFNASGEFIKGVATLMEFKTLIHTDQRAGQFFGCDDDRCVLPGEEGRRYRSFDNTILDLDSMEEWAHTANFFNTWAFNFDYLPDAKCPTWGRCLEDWFPGDPVAQETLEEILAYCMFWENELHKAFALLGQKRAGKGTIMRLLHRMMGLGFAAQNFNELADRFALQDLLEVAVVHLYEAVAGRDMDRVVGLIKAISGGDLDGGTTVKTKGGGSIRGAVIKCAFIMTGNDEGFELPDESGVIVDRIIALYFGQSFYGREDTGLDEKLAREMPGIFNRVLMAEARLRERGRFRQPDSGLRTLERLREAAAPGKTWFITNYEKTDDPGDYETKSSVLAQYVADLGGRSMTEHKARPKVRALMREQGVQEGRLTDSSRVEVWRGIKARTACDGDFDEVAAEGLL